ncbi:MAG: Dam family site-specific DNA-(adenine-N6)-methyltransferase, partial [Gammaproteobacteria bacterium]|nr:Dam family site-specific DNA-(adenine-N6)-methyltransferase [Gammaproteobacteria bacterium]
ALQRDNRLSKAVISDINAELIDTYITIRDYVENVIELLATYPHKEDFFYNLRAENPLEMDLPHRAARMIYMNKTCYNGLYRVNKQGKFNAPFGRYKSPTYNDPENLRTVSKALQNVDILCVSFETVLERTKPGDFVYFDPPYVPLSTTANFTSYHANGFDKEAQIKLRDLCLELTCNHIYIMLSNSATDIVKSLYDLPEFEVAKVLANRTINSNPKKRGKLNEYLVTNFSAIMENKNAPMR